MFGWGITEFLVTFVIILSRIEGRAVTTPPPPPTTYPVDTYCVIFGDGACNWNGKCIDRNDGSYYCECSSGYTGDKCEMSTTPQPTTTPTTIMIVYDTYCMIHGYGACNYNGKCVDTDDGSYFTCECDQGYTGPTCAMTTFPPTTTAPPTTTTLVYDTYCMIYGDSACNYNGKCVDADGGSSFTCECHSGYGGPTCLMTTPPPTTRQPTTRPPPTVVYDTYCMLYGNGACNYNGKCVDANGGSSFTCECYPGYSGQTCSRQER